MIAANPNKTATNTSNQTSTNSPHKTATNLNKTTTTSTNSKKVSVTDGPLKSSVSNEMSVSFKRTAPLTPPNVCYLKRTKVLVDGNISCNLDENTNTADEMIPDTPSPRKSSSKIPIRIELCTKSDSLN